MNRTASCLILLKAILSKVNLSLYKTLPQIIVIIVLLSPSGLRSQVNQPDNNSEGMIPFEVDWQSGGKADLDLSSLIQKPAGKQGHVRIKNGHFYLPDGQRLKIWGVNLTAGACFPEKNDAPVLAGYFARLGYNSVRFHFLDSNARGRKSSLFDDNLKTTRKLNDEQLDRLDYFVHALKENGIYSNFNLNVGRTYREEDGVPDFDRLGYAKAVTLFDDHIIMLEKEYARQLLTHRNPYTGNAYISESSLIIVECVNENSLVEAWYGGRLKGEKTDLSTTTWMDITSYYADELTQKYNNWLMSNRSGEIVNQIRKEAGVREDDMIPRLRPDEFLKASVTRFHAEAEFIINTERAFYDGMYRYLKDTLKIRSLVAANSDHSHYRSGYALLSNTSRLDLVDGHVYWQHPSETINKATGERSMIIKNTPMVNEPLISTIVQLARSPVMGKPYTVSEINHPFPNRYAAEGFGIFAAYALLQDWDGVYFYTYEGQRPELWNEKILTSFNIYQDPVKTSVLAAGALMFHRGDVKMSKKMVLRNYDQNTIIEGIRKNDKNMPFYTENFNSAIPLMYRTRIRSFSDPVNKFPDVRPENPITSDTKELKWYTSENRGIVTVETDRTRAFIGYLRDNTLKLLNFEADIQNEFGSVILTSLDGKAIEKSGKLLLSVTSRCEMSGMVWNENKTGLVAPGERPTLIEPLKGTLIVKNLSGKKQIILKPLDGRGNEITQKLIKAESNGSFIINVGTPATVWYILEVS